MPEVTVVIPTRDRSGRLLLTLRCVLEQRHVDVDVIVVDDGSTDDTGRAVKALADPRVQVLRHEQPQGVSSARNRGIATATGDWVALLDDDDLWAPDKLAEQLAAARSSDVCWVYAGDVTVDDGLRVIAGALPPSPQVVVADLDRHNAVPAGASNVIVRRNVLQQVGGFDPTLANNEDWDLWLRLARVGVPACVPRPLVAYRLHAQNSSANMPRMLAELTLIESRHGIAVDWPRHYRWAAWSCLEDGRGLAAAGYYLRAALQGDLASLGRAAVGLVHPGIAARRPADRADPWVRAAEHWLGPLRAG